jgi:hypothetical protein
MLDSQLFVTFFSIFLGVLLRTLLPSVKKIQAGQPWDHTYTATAGFAVLTSFITAVLGFQGLNLPTNIIGYFTVFVLSFIYGWGLNDFYNKIFADLQAPSTATPSLTPAPSPQPALPAIPTDAYQVKVGETFMNADITALLAQGYKRWYFPDGRMYSMTLAGGMAIGQTMTELGWVGVMPSGWKPMDTHP